MRRAIGDAAGLTIKAQIRRATANLGYGADAWRVREALYGRAGSWSAAALDDLRQRAVAARAREVEQSDPGGMAERIRAMRGTLAVLARQLDEIEVEVTARAMP